MWSIGHLTRLGVERQWNFCLKDQLCLLKYWRVHILGQTIAIWERKKLLGRQGCSVVFQFIQVMVRLKWKEDETRMMKWIKCLSHSWASASQSTKGTPSMRVTIKLSAWNSGYWSFCGLRRNLFLLVFVFSYFLSVVYYTPLLPLTQVYLTGRRKFPALAFNFFFTLVILDMFSLLFYH